MFTVNILLHLDGRRISKAKSLYRKSRISKTQAETWQVERKACKRVPWLLLKFMTESYLKFKCYILEYEHHV